jgi:hypothetical protein
MADCNDLFDEYYEAIRLTTSKRDSLKMSRDAIRDRIRNYFKETLKTNVPKFFGQGSYIMNTIVNPLDGEFDIDDGVYLQNLDSEKSKWETTETVHKWIVDATDGATDEKPIDKKRCVRVRYANNYHVDLPIYGVDRGTPLIAEKGERGWHESDPKALIDWFNSRIKVHGDQLRHIIRYFKAWADFQNQDSAPKMPSGLSLMILSSESFERSEREDVSFTGTTRKINNRFKTSPSIIRPVPPYDDLAKELSPAQIENFKVKLQALLEGGDQAIKDNDKVKASKIWRSLLGERFPEYNLDNGDKASVALKTGAPAILPSGGKSA